MEMMGPQVPTSNVRPRARDYWDRKRKKAAETGKQARYRETVLTR